MPEVGDSGSIATVGLQSPVAVAALHIGEASHSPSADTVMSSGQVMVGAVQVGGQSISAMLAVEPPGTEFHPVAGGVELVLVWVNIMVLRS